MVATPSPNTAQITEASAFNSGAGFVQTLQGIGERIFYAGRATVDFLREGLISNVEKAARIPDALKSGAEGFARNLIEHDVATARTVVGLGLLTTFVGFGARPASGQVINSPYAVMV